MVVLPSILCYKYLLMKLQTEFQYSSGLEHAFLA
jgi:hypothetical protein